MRIGLFGGSFDPVHNGHIKIAEAAIKQYNLDKVIFIPAKNPPHRVKKNLTDAKFRLEMLKLAIAGKRYFEVSDFELRRKKTTYTYETINHFKKKFSSDTLFFIIGSDSLKEMRYWKKGTALLKMCPFIIAPRPGFSCARNNRVLFLTDIAYPISSSDIRKNICQDKIKNDLPLKVFRYIRRKYLYIDELIKKYLNRHLDSAKYKHIIGASKTAVALALKFKADERKTLIASLLHDLGRTIKQEKYLDYIRKNRLKIPFQDEISRHNPFLFHSYISADLAKKKFNITDGEILKALTNHTFGQQKGKASIYDKIIYLSDTIAPDRRFAGVSEIRKIAFKNLDKAVSMCTALKLSYVIKKKKWLAPAGVDTYNSYL